MSSRRHPLRVLFNSDADELGTHCMHQCFISSSSYSEVKTELSFENYGPRRKTPGLGVPLMLGLHLHLLVQRVIESKAGKIPETRTRGLNPELWTPNQKPNLC